MVDKNPIGHSVKGSNGRDVHMVRPAMESRAGARRARWRTRTEPEVHTGTSVSERWELSVNLKIRFILSNNMFCGILRKSSFCCFPSAETGKYVEADTASCVTDCVYMLEANVCICTTVFICWIFTSLLLLYMHSFKSPSPIVLVCAAIRVT